MRWWDGDIYASAAGFTSVGDHMLGVRIVMDHIASQQSFALLQMCIAKEIYLIFVGVVGDFNGAAVHQCAGVRLLLEHGRRAGDVRGLNFAIRHVQNSLVGGNPDATLGDDYMAGIDTGAVIGAGITLKITMV